ncbi:MULTISPECIES: hypothetical protein [Comamonas]|uniref:hypothetical protein n=1 Tax=Comamonas TaxID=283 RepID=UPI00257FE99D|nr:MULTISPECIES: hypothetical protein [Comamonas]
MAVYKKLVGLAGALLASAVVAQPLDTSQTSLIQLAASMNEMALSCGHMSAVQLKKAQAKQREAMLNRPGF